ncbi:MAG: hypothetical protein LBR98_00735, partial [Syntrophomonadaceae bacterium]|nr:hypothetical protein [Syntrophomonadaceae bacterium]
MIKQIFIIIILSTAIFLLNYAGIPEYTAALAIAFAGGLSLLRRNQSGKIREKLALVAALAAGCIAYFMISGQAYGVYAGAAAFLAVGFSLTRIYKSKSDYRVWLMEVFPVLLRFVMFERIGGAISGLGHTFTISGFSVSVRYVEAFILMIAFCVFQSKENGHKYGKRVLAVPKLKGLKPFGKVVIAAALLVIWFNPFNMLVIDNIKNSIMDSLANFGTERSTISMISDSTGTSLLKVKSDTAVTSESAAYKLLTSYDKELGGEFVFISSEKLPSGNTVYSFSQISNDIPILGGVKKLVVGLDNKPLYIVGETRTGVTNLRKPQNGISEQQAISQMNSFLDG